MRDSALSPIFRIRSAIPAEIIYFTPHISTCRSDSAEGAEPEAGAPEIEISPEMLRAEADELCCYDVPECDPVRVVTAILVAMGAVRGPKGGRLRKRMDGDADQQISGSASQEGRPMSLKVTPRGPITWRA
jgi:hypothetical protein